MFRVAEPFVLGLIQLCVPPPGHLRLAAETLETLQEHLVEEAVNHEVRGRVQGQQHVRKLPDPFHEVGRLMVPELEHRGHDGVGRDADEEGQDDDNHHERHAVARAVALVGARLA